MLVFELLELHAYNPIARFKHKNVFGYWWYSGESQEMEEGVPNIGGYYTCNIRVEYEGKPLRCACCKVFGHVQEECPKNIGTGETKNLKKNSQTRKGKVTLVDDDGKSLLNVASSCDYDSEDDVAFVDNEMANFLAKKDGYGTQSLLKQWTKSYENDEYGYYAYDDDMYEEWLKIDSVVLSWIFMTLSKTLQARLVVEDPQTAKESWDLIAEIFNDNKLTCCIALKAKLYSLKLSDLSIDAYYRKIESIDTILTSLGLPISIDDVVTIAFEGLHDKYENVSSIIVHREPFLNLKMVCSMLTTEEMRLQSRDQATSIDSSSSSPMVLLANSSNTIRRPTVVSGESNKPCFNFASGFCRFGDACKYMHGGVTNRGNSNTSPWSNNNSCPTSSSTTPPTMTPEQIVALIQSQQAILVQLRKKRKRKKEDPWNSIIAGVSVRGFLSLRQGAWLLVGLRLIEGAGINDH
uniref:Hybrid signal transduction histidine kinase M n=1 Tax=Tanacetum cinerariifolium TaxID=118510 RepID=A0A6L2JWP9_TANCI|nr:hybrid signal transduction histidine kinase M [Tanacetum cinerariifolium]